MQVMRCFASCLASCVRACVLACLLAYCSEPRLRTGMRKTVGEEQAVLDVSKASSRPLMSEKREMQGIQQLAATASSGSQLGLQECLHADCQFRCRCRCGGTGCEWLRIRLKVDVRLELEKVGGEACVERLVWNAGH